MNARPTVRTLDPGDVPRAVELHLRVLDMEFLSRFGPGFLRRYYRAWAASPGAIALVAVDDGGRVVGSLLGATDPGHHVRSMVRRHGAGLAFRMVVHGVRHPALGAELMATRARRYAGGLWRLLVGAVRKRPRRGAAPGAGGADPEGEAGRRVGEITHLLVDPDRQGSGIGRALVDEALRLAGDAGADEVELVTPPDLAAGRFYERLGWHADGSITSKSGEPFVRYRHPTAPPSPPASP